jgi:hypothetical protein
LRLADIVYTSSNIFISYFVKFIGEKMILKKIGVMSLAKIYGIFGLIFGIIVGILVALFGSTLGALGGVAGIGAGISIVAAIIMIVVYAIGGFIAGAILAVLYNFIAPKVGGVELDLE